jgi:glutathione S-transferase
MKLLGHTTSINVRKVLWTAHEIGLRFEHEEEWGTPARSSRSPYFLRLNPNGLVPVWLDERGALWESNTICRYLAARHERRDLLPDEPRERAMVERWMDWSAGDLNKAWSYAFLALVRREPSYANDAEIARSIEAWNALMATLDGHLAKSGRYACGETFTLGDVTLGLAAPRWTQTPMPRPDLRSVSRYLGTLRERPAFAALATDQLP